MKILITGANGLLGQKLVALLTSRNDVELIATSRGENRISGFNKVRYEVIDVANRAEVIDKFKLLAPDAVIHTAAMTHVDECELNPEQCKIANVEAVRNVVEACSTIQAHLVHISTDFIFDGSHGPLTEEELPKPINYYGQTKLDAEKIIMGADISWSIARTILVYGVVSGLKRSNIILWVKDSLENGKSIQVVDDQWRTPTLAEDLAIGCWLLAKDKRQGVYNISGEDLLTPYEMANLVADHFNLDKSYMTRADSSTFSQPALRPPKTGFVIDKAKTDLGYHPHSFEEGIQIIANQIS